MVRRKGFEPFVSKVLPELFAVRQDWVCLIVGSGPERAVIESAVQDHGLAAHVRLTGELGDEALRAAYALAHVFVMPNVPVQGDMEGFGVVTLEARAAGLPIVAADLEGISEALGDPRDGVLVPSGDWSAFVQAILDCLDRTENPMEREERRQRIETRFAWGRIATEYMAVFDGVREEYERRRRDRVAHRS
jgi:phosphatidylinositol alpha-1,6-mannosyltransferase